MGLTGRYQLTRALALDVSLVHSYDGGSRGYSYVDESVDSYYESDSYVSTTLVTERLDVGGYLTALRRTAIGSFRAADAVTLECLRDVGFTPFLREVPTLKPIADLADLAPHDR